MDLFDDTANRLLNRLHDELDGERRKLLSERRRDGELLDFLPESEATTGDWRISPVPPALAGPPRRDHRADLEEDGHQRPQQRRALLHGRLRGLQLADLAQHDRGAGEPRRRDPRDALARGGRQEYELNDDIALLLARVRGLHLPEAHLDSGVCGAFMDFALYVRHNHEALADRGWGPFFYIPKLESHLEARLWNRAFEIAEEELSLERGTIRATVLIETVPAAFQMEEILYELRDHAAGLNAGRWDYLFSMIKCFRERPEFVLPDRNQVTMTVPFMHAYTEQLVSVCHRRGAHAMGGMSAVIPSRTDEEANQRALDAVSGDKKREAEQGYDGTWVAHPDSVPVAMEEFDKVLGDRPNQLDKLRDDVSVTAKDLLSVGETPGTATVEGLANDVNVGIQYISSWLRGNGAAGIYGLMEDAATAEIARGQVWQWIRHSITLDNGKPVTPELVQEMSTQELAKIREEIGDDTWFEREGRPDLSRQLFESMALSGDDRFEEFLTLPAYQKLLEIE